MEQHYATIVELVESQGAKIFSVEFVKKDGSYRRMQCQNAATATHCVAEPSERAKRAAATRRENHPNLLPIFSMDAAAIRSINMDTLLRLTGSGKVLWEAGNAGQLIYEAKHVGEAA